MAKARRVVRVVIALAMIWIGVMHFVKPAGFVKIVPKFLPSPLVLVLISGFFEVLGGVGLLIPRVRKWASYGLVALYVSVFPANVNMAIHHIDLDGRVMPDWALWLRLPFQLVFIGLALWVGREDEKDHSLSSSSVSDFSRAP
ncbi:MAG: DoxX family protein [Polyangiales bacterium]